MLYVTTRTDRDAYTPHRTLTGDPGGDAGQFLPRQMPFFDEAALRDVAERSFNENIAHVLGLLFRQTLTGRDVELVLGKRSAGILDLNSRTMASEIWRDADGSFEETVRRLHRLLAKEPDAQPGQWFTQAVWIAMLFGVYGELMARGIVSEQAPMDVALPSFDFQLPMAAWYARTWGLPIGSIICACNENNAPWCLLHQGEMRTDTALQHTVTPACDQAVPAGLERLIRETLGRHAVEKYLSAVAGGELYKLEDEQQALLRRGLYVYVVSRRRMEFMVPNIYRSGRWTPDPYAAMAYSALADHRARTGETGKALVLALENPACAADALEGFLGLSAGQLRQKLEQQ